MKKTIMGIAAMTLLLASCSKNEVTSDNPVNNDDSGIIGFESYTGSRATDNTIAELQTATGFNVVAFHTLNNNVELRFKDDYKFSNSVWSWPGEDAKYLWPTDLTATTGTYPLTFVSFFPTPNEFTNGFAYAAPEIAVAIAPAVADQKDYISAVQTVNALPSTGRATLAFKHILSKILFQVNATAGYKVNIQSIKIVNVADQSTNTTDQPKFNAVTGLWVNPLNAEIEGAQKYVYKDHTSTAQEIIATTLVTGNSGALMLLPQYGTKKWDAAGFKTAAVAALKTLTDAVKTNAEIITGWEAAVTAAGTTAWSNARIEVIYNVRTTDDAYVTGLEDKFVRVGYALDLVEVAQAWVMGNQYTYTIELGGASVSGGILLDPFYTDNNGTPDSGGDKPSVTPGDPINNSSGIIGFDVKVDKWAEKTVSTEPAKPIV